MFVRLSICMYTYHKDSQLSVFLNLWKCLPSYIVFSCWCGLLALQAEHKCSQKEGSKNPIMLVDTRTRRGIRKLVSAGFYGQLSWVNILVVLVTHYTRSQKVENTIIFLLLKFFRRNSTSKTCSFSWMEIQL